MFDGGSIRCHVENIKLNKGLGEEYEIPVPWYLIEHPRGLVVIDGGIAAECATDPEEHWGRTSRVFWPVLTPEQACVPALRAAGFDPADVRYVLQSHMHSDHTGALGAIDQFPNADVLVRRAEYQYAFAPDWFASAGYIHKDFNKPDVPGRCWRTTMTATTYSGTAWSAAGTRPATLRVTSRSRSRYPAPARSCSQSTPPTPPITGTRGAARVPHLRDRRGSLGAEIAPDCGAFRCHRGHRSRPRDVADVPAQPRGV